MNREIKFRGQRVDNGEWVFGVPSTSTYYDEETGYKIYACIITGTEHNPTTGFMSPPNSFFVSVIPETIGQSTGLKDSGGVDIYEGDIIEDDGNIYKIEWDKNGLCWQAIDLISNDNIQLGEFYDSGTTWLQGNIHDNPELLK